MPHAHLSFRHRSVIQPDPLTFPRLTHFGRLDGVRRDHYPLHSHGVTEYFYFMGGRAHLDLGPLSPGSFQVGDGDLLVIPPGMPHRFFLEGLGPTGAIHYYWFGFSRRALSRRQAQNPFLKLVESLDLEGPALGTNPGARLSYQGTLRPLLEGLHRELQEPQVATTELVWAHLIQFFALLKRSAAKPHLPRGMDAVQFFLSTELGRRVGLDELADRSGLHPSSLVRAFHQNTGMAPLTFHRHRRLDLAKALLAGGSSVTDAAGKTGYPDLSQFNRAFKKYTGASPRDWRTRVCPG